MAKDGRSSGGSNPSFVRPDETEHGNKFPPTRLAALTLRAYASDWAAFTAWCEAQGVSALPATPEAIIGFISAQAKGEGPDGRTRRPLATSSLSRARSAINHYHREASLPLPARLNRNPAFGAALTRILQSRHTEKVRKTAIGPQRLDIIFAAIVGDDIRSVRDRALLSLGVAAALRRSELAALQFDDIRVVPDGLILSIGSAAGKSRRERVAISVLDGERIRPKALLLEWLHVSGIASGPIFRRLAPARMKAWNAETGRASWRHVGDRVRPTAMCDRSVARIVKARAEAAGLDPALFGGHSLRSGFLTESVRQPGATFLKTLEVSRLASMGTLPAYIEESDPFENHAGDGFL
ncbi:integrase [Sphingomonas sp. 179-A 2A2 NHS]|uniref:integrase n=1 Tax=Sphingomonas sp. 179-A 2A2 NHS TaxID=3374290 RepID=UPI00387A0F3D